MNEITETQGKNAFELHKSIVRLKVQMGVAFLELGRLLKEIRDKELFKVLGYDSFQAYLTDSELGFKRRTAYYYIEIYEWYVGKLSYDEQYLAEIGHDGLIRMLPIVKKEYPNMPESRLKELMMDAKELRHGDFDKKYKDEEKQNGHDDYLSPPEYFRCECHSKWRIIVPREDCCPEWLKEFTKQSEKEVIDKGSKKD